jgi:hypothetical protein
MSPKARLLHPSLAAGKSFAQKRNLGRPLNSPTYWSTWRDFHHAITKPGYHNLPGCYSRTIAYFSKTAMLINKRRFSAEHFIDSFGGGIR